jgi:GNAT superfamily N-acetyltransferase
VPIDASRSLIENLACGMQFYGRARPSGEIRDLTDQCLIYCGLNYAAFNAAVLRAPLVSHPRELMRLIEEARDFFEPRGVRWTYWLCDASLEPALARDARDIFRRYSLQLLTEAPGMYAERLAPPGPRYPVVELHDASDASDASARAAFARIIAATFDIPPAICTAVYENERGWRGNFQGYVGYREGQPVTTAAVVEGGGAIGFYSVATLPAHRRRGYAEATMRQVLCRVQQQAAAPLPTVLQSTQAGLKLDEKMGYRAAGNFRVFIA